jgi:hypothetical protein
MWAESGLALLEKVFSRLVLAFCSWMSRNRIPLGLSGYLGYVWLLRPGVAWPVGRSFRVNCFHRYVTYKQSLGLAGLTGN